MKHVTYLAHHGVLGMKWGVRNSDTLARYARASRTRKNRKKPFKNAKNAVDAVRKAAKLNGNDKLEAKRVAFVEHNKKMDKKFAKQYLASVPNDIFDDGWHTRTDTEAGRKYKEIEDKNNELLWDYRQEFRKELINQLADAYDVDPKDLDGYSEKLADTGIYSFISRVEDVNVESVLKDASYLK